LARRIVILGAGESGTGAAVLARKKGMEAFISDSGIIKKEYKSVLSQFEIGYEEGGHSPGIFRGVDEVVKSPGIPDHSPLIRGLREQGIRIISEIEFAGRYTDARKVCVTGTNGKTTTTHLISHIFKKAGLNVGMAGNVGKSFAMMVATEQHDCYVLEISSFQLDGMFEFKADVAVLLNITPDHLDRYENDMQKYTESKFRIIQNQTADDAFIYCMDDMATTLELNRREVRSRMYPFTLSAGILQEEGAFVDRNKITIRIKPKEFTMTLDSLALQGKHNIYNSMAAGIAAKTFNIRKDIIKESLSDFQNIEHRLEFVARIHGVSFINDSKATNVNSVWYALESMDKPVIWIAGGIDKGNDYSILEELVRTKVKGMICLGKDNQRLVKAFGDIVGPIYETTSVDEAVRIALYLGQKDDVALLSPACASFDLFENFEDRGNQFKNAVKRL
jgi:UDP-N-acetylmuramoylalanine--D-glutamate ligase